MAGNEGEEFGDGEELDGGEGLGREDFLAEIDALNERLVDEDSSERVLPEVIQKAITAARGHVDLVVPAFPTVDAAVAALDAKNRYKPGVNLYPRDGSEKLSEAENRVAALVGMEPGEVLLYNSGMAAVSQAIGLADLSRGDVAAVPDMKELYSQIYNFVDRLNREQGVKMVRFYSDDIGRIERNLLSNKANGRPLPKLFFAETVANGPGTQIVDIEKLLNLSIFDEEEGYDPLIILDNTVPTPTILPFGDILAKTNRRVLVVESGTKNYALNRDLLGLVYTKHPELLAQLRRYRRMNGALPGVGHVENVLSLLPSKEDFDSRNGRIISNAKLFAEALHGRLEEVSSPFRVSHPNLPSHKQYAYAQEHFPQGPSQVFFLSLPDGINQEDFLRQVWHGPFTELAKLGQSFGFGGTRVWHVGGVNFPAIRIATGTEDPEVIEFMAEQLASSVNTIS